MLRKFLFLMILLMIAVPLVWGDSQIDFGLVDVELPEIIMPGWGAVLTEDGDLIIWALGPMFVTIDGITYEVDIGDVVIKDFYTPVEKPGFFKTWILPPLICAGAGLVGTAIAQGDESWQYVASGAIGFGLGFIISAVINGSNK